MEQGTIVHLGQRAVLYPAISWEGEFPPQNPKFPPEKHPKYKKC